MLYYRPCSHHNNKEFTVTKLSFGEGRPPYHSFNLNRYDTRVDALVVYDQRVSALSTPPGADPNTWRPSVLNSVEIQLPGLVVRLRLIDISPDNDEIKEAASIIGVTAFFLATVLITGYK
jgi:hypothetical protein